MTDSIGLMSKSAGGPLGGSKRRPLGSWSLQRENIVEYNMLFIHCHLVEHLSFHIFKNLHLK